ncbi:integral membrane protein, TerC family [Candidatus Nitrosopumilus salaria BD31]|uniref:Integral membrane protein, TerC family n=1 Tax=Candidatus Nitrosopumilus salarius BD31 TaxID=859350 RepID=I3D4Y6_9ARCH|nr:TerC/Alx family metal homeostasis membrane protein [Candidatus Nitrosopumilus salaria]EIJ66779.1 integral membrane protein, TerC family [Candidatus Nitrosopumilus salaria BD31]
MQLSEFELWVVFGIIIGISLSVDLGVINKIRSKFKNKFENTKTINIVDGLSFKQSLVRSIVWIILAGIFAIIIFFTFGEHKTLEFLTGYVLEESLSVDNMMLFLLVFTTLGIPHKYQKRILSVGILSAIGMRIFVILVGASLLDNFHWMIYVFGGILLIGAFRMIFQRKEDKIDLEKNVAVKFLKKFMPIRTEITEQKFFTKIDGVLYATPLFVALIIIEMTDLVFAMDSIPAVLAITTDPFIVITSNIFAISGLRALYFLISSVIHKLYYLKTGLIVLLFFISIKMIISEIYEISTIVSFMIVALILSIVIIASIIKASRVKNES